MLRINSDKNEDTVYSISQKKTQFEGSPCLINQYSLRLEFEKSLDKSGINHRSNSKRSIKNGSDSGVQQQLND